MNEPKTCPCFLKKNAPPEDRRVICTLCGRIAGGQPPHRCHAEGCEKEVPAKMLMCIAHWKRVPKHIQAMIWAHYRPGQEISKDPSPEYLEAVRTAIAWVATKEKKR